MVCGPHLFILQEVVMRQIHFRSLKIQGVSRQTATIWHSLGMLEIWAMVFLPVPISCGTKAKDTSVLARHFSHCCNRILSRKTQGSKDLYYADGLREYSPVWPGRHTEMKGIWTSWAVSQRSGSKELILWAGLRYSSKLCCYHLYPPARLLLQILQLLRILSSGDQMFKHMIL